LKFLIDTVPRGANGLRWRNAPLASFIHEVARVQALFLARDTQTVILQPAMAVTELGETALAQIVLAAQKRVEAEAERDEDSLPCFVWNEIRESARVRNGPMKTCILPGKFRSLTTER